MFDKLKRLLNNVQKLDETQAWFFSIDREVQDEIIRLNTIDQLYDRGIDSDEQSLGEYHPITQAYKISVGERYDHVTLKDTGAFYDSFRIEIDARGFNIVADDEAFYDRPLTEVYGLEILGLTQENTEWLGAFIKDKYQEYVRRTLLQ